MNDVLDISERIRVLPLVHGSGDFAQEVRRVLLGERCPGFRFQQRHQVKLFLALRQVDTGAGFTGVGTGGRPHQVAVGDQNRVGAGLRPPGQLLLRPLDHRFPAADHLRHPHVHDRPGRHNRPYVHELRGLAAAAVFAGKHPSDGNFQAADRSTDAAGIGAALVGELPNPARVAAGPVTCGRYEIILGPVGSGVAEVDDVAAPSKGIYQGLAGKGVLLVALFGGCDHRCASRQAGNCQPEKLFTLHLS